jgi:hypothetical protein
MEVNVNEVPAIKELTDATPGTYRMTTESGSPYQIEIRGPGDVWKDVTMPKPYPPEFCRDVVAVACKHEAPLGQIAKDFGIS